MIEFIVTSSALIVVIIILRCLFQWKISRRLQYALWGIVLLRLLMPFSLFSSQFSIMNMFATVGIDKPEPEISAAPNINTDNEMTPVGGPLTGNAALNDAEWRLSGNGSDTLGIESTAETRDILPDRILGATWLAGSIAAGLWFLSTNLIFYRRLRKTRNFLRRSECKLPVYITQGLDSPCLFGIMHPAIYLTPKAAENVDNTRFVLAHEQCHYRHGDHIWSMMRVLCLAVWWWNPLVWLAAMLSRTDSETACDEAVIRQLGEDSRFIYGRTLVDMIAVKKERVSLMCAATAMASGKSRIKLRLNMIIKKPKTFIPAFIAVVLIVAVGMGCTFTGATEHPTPSTGNVDVSAYAQKVYDNRTVYIGDASADSALLNALEISDKLGSYTLELDTQQAPYILRLVFSDEITEVTVLNRMMNNNAMLLLALIDNASEIQWHYNSIDPSEGGNGEFTGALTLADATAALNGIDIKSYGKSATDVQALLDWLDTANEIFSQATETTSPASTAPASPSTEVSNETITSIPSETTKNEKLEHAIIKEIGFLSDENITSTRYAG